MNTCTPFEIITAAITELGGRVSVETLVSFVDVEPATTRSLVSDLIAAGEVALNDGLVSVCAA